MQGVGQGELKRILAKNSVRIKHGPYRGCAWVWVQEPIATRSNGYRHMWYNTKTDQIEELPEIVKRTYHLWACSDYCMKRTMTWAKFLRKAIS